MIEETLKPPKPIIHVVIDIGGETWPDILNRLQHELLEAERTGGGQLRRTFWGGAGTHGHVEIETRDGCTPDQYNAELEVWFQQQKAAKAGQEP